MKKRIITIIAVLIGVAIIAMLFIPRETSPSPETRVILEHNRATYIAPSCFEQADPSNFLEETALEEAKQEHGYEANSTCTEEALADEDDSMLLSLLKDIGILDKKWDELDD